MSQWELSCIAPDSPACPHAFSFVAQGKVIRGHLVFCGCSPPLTHADGAAQNSPLCFSYRSKDSGLFQHFRKIMHKD